MRVVVVVAMLTAPMMLLGWPSPWVVVCGAFAAGFVARRPSRPRVPDPRPGYLDVSQLELRGPTVAERVKAYTGGELPDVQAFGLPLERPEFGDCEGCGGR